MQNVASRTSSYFLVGALGAAMGGMAVLLITEALPKMMSRTMSEMMRNMAAQAGEGECSPVEM